MLSKFRNIILVVVFFNACSTEKTDFSSNEKTISGTKLNIGCLIGMPLELIHLDSLLCYYDMYDNQAVTVFDTKNEKFVRRFLTVGQGPEEVLVPLKLFVSTSENRIYAFQIQKGSVSEYEPDDIIVKDNIAPQQYIFGDRPANIKKIRNGYIGIGMFDDGRFRLYDSSGKIISACGKYPFRGEEMDQMARFFIYQGFLCTSADGNCFAMGTSYCDNLEFYRLENGTAVLTKKYESDDAKVQFSNRIQIDDDCIMNYKAAYGGKYCYMLYSGKTYLEKDKVASGGRRIIVFDWNGNYLRSYKVDADIFSFCVDEENNIIYASIRDYEDEGGFSILKFNL